MSYIGDREDFYDKDDRGRYKHPDEVGGIAYEILEARVFAALRKDIRALPRIKEHAKLEKSFDLTPVISGMELDEKIRRVNDGNITAFFLFEQMPERFWNRGDGTVGARFDPDFVPVYNFRKEETVEIEGDMEIDEAQLEDLASTLTTATEIAKAVGLSSAAKLYPIMKHSDPLRDAFDRGRRKFAIRQNPDAFDEDGNPKPSPVSIPEVKSTPSTRRENMSTKPEKVNTSAETTEPERITEEETMSTGTATAQSTLDEKKSKAYRLETISEAEMEVIAAEELNIHDVAKRVADVGQPAFSRMLNRRPAIRQAYQRGIAKRSSNSANGAAGGATASRKTGGRGFPIRFTAEQCENAAVEKGTLVGTAMALGYASPTPFKKKLDNDPDLAAAFKLGRARFTGETPTPAQVEESIEAAATTEQETPEAPSAADHVETVPADQSEKINITCSTCQNLIGRGDEMLFTRIKSETEIRTYYFCSIDCQNAKLDELAKFKEIALAEPLPDPPQLISEISDEAAEQLIEEVTEFYNELLAELPVNDPLPPFDKTAAEFVPAFEGRAERFKVRPESFGSIAFADGSKLSVTFDGNVFNVTPRDRAILSHIVDLIREYPDGINMTQNTRPPKRSLWNRIWDN